MGGGVCLTYCMYGHSMHGGTPGACPLATLSPCADYGRERLISAASLPGIP
jgi:hypothetical protein